MGHARRERSAPLLISHTRSCGTQPAHMSRDTAVDDSRCAPLAQPTPQTSGPTTPAHLTSRTPYEPSGMSPEAAPDSSLTNSRPA